MTFILNILHKDISILAADKHAVLIGGAQNKPSINNYQKITLNSSNNFALGISGYTHEHAYTPEISFASGADECIIKIRRYMDNFLKIHDRKGLNELDDIMQNEGVATFYDDNLGTFYTNAYLFSAIEMRTKLHRGTDEIKIFHAGTGSRYFNNDLNIQDLFKIDEVIDSIKNVYKNINNKDIYTGSDVTIFIARNIDGKFSEINHC